MINSSEYIRKMIDIQTPDGLCDSYVTFHKDKKNQPVVLLYMDAIGLRKRIFDMADHIAGHGYYVIAPNVFYRSKRAPVVDYELLLKPNMMPELFVQVMQMAKEITPELSKHDAKALIEFIDQQPQVNASKIGATGYCMGGGQALRNAGNFPDRIQAVASFHTGNIATDADTSPHLWFNKIKAEVYIAFADKDKFMPPEQIVRVQEEVSKAKLKAESEFYKGCLHGWTMSDLAVHNQEGEEKHWKKLFELFDRNLK